MQITVDLSQVSTSFIYCAAFGCVVVCQKRVYVNMCGGCMEETVFGLRLKTQDEGPNPGKETLQS